MGAPLLTSACLQSVVADGLDRAFFHGRRAGSFLGGAFGLADDEAVAPGVVAAKLAGAVSRQRSQSMQVAST